MLYSNYSRMMMKVILVLWCLCLSSFVFSATQLLVSKFGNAGKTVKGGGNGREKKTIEKSDNVDDLEKVILAKYGSNAYKNALLENKYEDDDDEYEQTTKKKSQPRGIQSRIGRFQGFNPPNFESDKSTTNKFKGSASLDSSVTSPPKSLLGRLKSKLSTDSTTLLPSKLIDIDIDENSFDDDEGFAIEKVESDIISTASELEGLKSENSGFRLRKPVPILPEIDTKKAAKKALDDEKAFQVNREKKLLDKSNYYSFDFTDEDQLKLAKVASDNLFTSKSFSDIGIDNAQVVRNLERMSIFNPTKIQEKSIPLLLQGQDVVMQAQTGSGKTLAFLLPLLATVNPAVKKVQAIIIAPSRELVTQIGLIASTVFEDTGINVISLIGGANVQNQIKRLRADKPQIVVATPGRLAELVFRLRKLRLGMVRSVIIDEVDNMLKEPYIGEIQTILEGTPLFGSKNAKNIINYRNVSNEDDNHIDDDDSDGDGESDASQENHFNNRLICLASATGNDPDVSAFASRYLSSTWKYVSIDSAMALPSTITHGLISSPRIKALELLKKFLLAKPAVKSALIFVNDPYRVEVLCEQLLKMGMVAAPLHGDTSKDDRKEIISRLKDGRVNLVVTTELAARGLDIPDLSHVINFELPTDAQHYIHRAGRCGRAGRQGLVMNFANPDTKFVIRRFGKQLKCKVLDCDIRDGRVFLKSR